MEPKRKKSLIITTCIFLILGGGLFLYWLDVWRIEEYTDDCYVNGNMVQLNAQITGIVTSINADNTDYVEQDQLIIELDDTDYKIAYEKAQGNLAETIRQVVKMFQDVKMLAAEVEQKEAFLLKASDDYNNRVELVDIGGVSREEFEHVTQNLAMAQADLSSTHFSLKAAEALVKNTYVRTHPLVIEAKEQCKEAYVNLKRTKIRAPASGTVAMRSAQVGEQINPGKPLLAIVPLDEIWVDANYKETQLSKMRIGQRVSLTADIYGSDVKFHGRVQGLNPGTGAVFSILPPQNATGNWIKIVQRIPVRIRLEKEQFEKYPLMLGMTMEATTDISDTSGDVLTKAKTLRPLYSTDVYQKQEEGFNEVFEAILKANE
ncbi:MAG: Multidrug export protein EmrA [Chlamydiia bacterium]|nr:Multidrug export protein EmrA [Chlamydiia bacterium]MCH9615487.1 Multidrug export protein EmrA [Chlamydiia bacterium]MCH9629142.1 Multidrug export protein EmrA [Chlamydiia bacterium]